MSERSDNMDWRMEPIRSSDGGEIARALNDQLYPAGITLNQVQMDELVIAIKFYCAMTNAMERPARSEVKRQTERIHARLRKFATQGLPR